MEATAPRRGTTLARPTTVLDQALDLSRVNWEMIAYAVLFVILVGTRFWDLGGRALHHDESIHGYYSYLQFQGNPWQYQPAYHGPFLYNFVALGFALFGATDATVRIMPAIFGSILVGLCLFLRPYLGRLGTLVAAVLVIFSPSIMYYSRSLRHDIFATVGTMMLFVAILGFLRTHRGPWVYLGALGAAIAYTSHELSFINFFIFLSFLVVAWAWLRFLGAPGDRDRALGFNPISEALRALFGPQRWALIGGIGLFVAIYVLLFSNLLTYPQGIGDGLFKGIGYWFGQHGVARGNQPLYYYALLLMPIYELLAYVTAFVTLIVLGVRLLMGKADVPPDLPAEAYPDSLVRVRGDERERKNLSVSTEGSDEAGFGLPSAAVLAGFTVVFLAWWCFAALIAYSLAGEKMPWLNMQMALPFSLLAAAGIGRLLQRVDWRAILKQGGLFMGVLGVLLIFAFLSFLANLNQLAATGLNGNEVQQATMMRALVLAAFILLIVGGIAWFWLRIGASNGWRVLAMTAVVIGLLYGVRSTWMLNFRNGDVPIELLVYTQSAPDTVLLSDRIIRLSRDLTAFSDRNVSDVTGGRSMQIGLDNGIEWPFDWYLRDQRKVSRFTTHDGSGKLVAGTALPGDLPNGSPVFLVSDDFQATQAWQDFVKDKYTGTHYKLRWWFPQETYEIQAKDAQGNLKFDANGQQIWDTTAYLGTYLGNLLNPTAWAQPVKYMLYRDPGAPLGSTDVWFYVRNDLLTRVGNVLGDLGTGASTGTDTGGTTTQPQQPSVTYGMFDLAPEGNGKGQFNKPRGIAQGPDGSFYVVDTSNLRVEKFDKDGKFLLSFGSAGSGDGQFQALLPADNNPAPGTGPGGIAVDPQGNVYVADTWNHRMQKFDRDGKFIRQWGGFINLGDAAANAAEGQTKFFGPRGVAVDKQGNIYVTDTGNRRVMEYDGNGTFIRQFGQGLTPALVSVPNNGPNQLNEPIGVAVDAQGNVYVADTNNRRIVKFDKSGQAVTNWAVNAFAPGPYNEPFMAMGPDGNLYVSDPTGQQVLKYDPTGKELGSKKAQGTSTLSRPTGLTVLPDGTVYVVDTDKAGVVKLGTVP